MREYCTSGSVRGAARKGSLYRGGGMRVESGGPARSCCAARRYQCLGPDLRNGKQGAGCAETQRAVETSRQVSASMR